MTATILYHSIYQFQSKVPQTPGTDGRLKAQSIWTLSVKPWAHIQGWNLQYDIWEQSFFTCTYV